jgi:hypothetical protein
MARFRQFFAQVTLALMLIFIVGACGEGGSPVDPPPPPPKVYAFGQAVAAGTNLTLSPNYMAQLSQMLAAPSVSTYEVSKVDSIMYNGALGSFPALVVRFKGAVFGTQIKQAYGCDCLLLPLSGDQANLFYMKASAAEVWASLAEDGKYSLYFTLVGTDAALVAKKMGTVMRSSAPS